MKVRVLKAGFIYGSLRRPGETLTLKQVEHSTEKGENGKPLIISVEQQFSSKWMEKVKAGRPKDSKGEE
jgi:hypothetical protein